MLRKSRPISIGQEDVDGTPAKAMNGCEDVVAFLVPAKGPRLGAAGHKDLKAQHSQRSVTGHFRKSEARCGTSAIHPSADLQLWVPSVRFLPVACAGQAERGRRCAGRSMVRWCGMTLPSFAVRCFRELNPRTGFAMNWHVEVVAAKLAAVRDGKIRRLIISLPPRHLKSLLASVAFPAWCLGPDRRVSAPRWLVNRGCMLHCRQR